MKRKIKQEAKELLNSANLRRTGPRVAILSVLLGVGKPQTANQIAARLAPPAVNKVTIYRTLGSLLRAGLVHKAFLQKRTWNFELANRCSSVQCHPHFTCTSCGDMHCLTEMSMPMAKSPHKDFVIHHQRVQLEGLCPDCSAKQ